MKHKIYLIKFIISIPTEKISMFLLDLVLKKNIKDEFHPSHEIDLPLLIKGHFSDKQAMKYFSLIQKRRDRAHNACK